MIETTSNFYDQAAAQFDIARRAYSPELGEMLEGFGFLPGKSILDVGCGTGAAISLLTERGCVMTGIDSSEAMLDVAKKRAQNATYVQGAAEALPFADHAFDGVVSGQTFHHLDQEQAFREAMRVTKRGGHVALFWKLYSFDEPVARIRAAAFRELGIEMPPEPLSGGFRSFYAAPFIEHALRVVPMASRATLQAEVAHERTRLNTVRACGDRLDAFSELFLAKLCEEFGEPQTPVIMQFVQFLYVGTV